MLRLLLTLGSGHAHIRGVLEGQGVDPHWQTTHSGHAHRRHGGSRRKRWAELAVLRQANERYRDFESRERTDTPGSAGWKGRWWANTGTADRVDPPLDLMRPSTLQNAVVNGERILVGGAYTADQRPWGAATDGFCGPVWGWDFTPYVSRSTRWSPPGP